MVIYDPMVIYDHILWFLRRGIVGSGKKKMTNQLWWGRHIHIDRFRENNVYPSRVGKKLWFFDTKLSHAGTQCAAVKTKDFGRTVFAAHFPLGLLKHPNNIFPFYILKGPISLC